MTWELRNLDCLAPNGMPSLPDKSVDVVITDPPYSEHVHSHHRVAAKQNNDLPGEYTLKGGAVKRRFGEAKTITFEHITQDVMEAAADHFARLARRWVLVFCDMESAHLWRGALESTGGLEYLRTCAWHKLGGTPQFTGDRPAVWGEAIVVCHPKGRKRWNGGGKQGLYSYPTAIDRDRSGLDLRLHTTQKPVALMEALIRDFTEPGELILDGFAGSGSTGVAALRLGRRFLGFERDAAMHAAATARLNGERALPDGYQDARQGALF